MKLFQSWKSYFYTLLLHPTKAMVWIKLNSNKNYCLPCVQIDQAVWLSNFSLIKKAIEKELEIAINILHYASFQVERKQKKIQGIYVLEPANLAPEIHDEFWCDRLLTLGCLDRRLKRLQSQIVPLINYAVNICELSAPEIDQLYKLAPYLQSLCCQLEDYNIPETLVHGDLHLHNVAFNEGEYLVFDWTDSCITHPFFDLFDLFFAAKGHSWWVYVQSLWKPNTLKHLRNTYLSQWLEYESAERLLEAWKLAKPLCALHHAVTYQYIMANLEPRSKHEFNHALPNFLREMIKSTSQLRANLLTA